MRWEVVKCFCGVFCGSVSMHLCWFIVDKVLWKLSFVSALVQGIIVRTICATMHAPPNHGQPAAQPVNAFKKIDAVTKWLEQYEEIRDRYLFLVLDGDSQYGKSRFAASLTTADKFFPVDCSSGGEPELRLFDRELHDVVCFDEAKPSMIIRVKKLAQAGVDMARLGQSCTHLASYQVWFHRVKLVICSSGWEVQLRDLPQEDVAWLKKNSVYVKVTEQLFE